MLRALHKSKIPIWHTEGFNPHPFATFPLPLSLGFRGVNECMDVRLEEDDFSFEEITERLNACLPRGIRVFDVTEPVMKAGRVAFASFTLLVSLPQKPSSLVCEQLNGLLAQDAIEIEKKSKRGMKTVDIRPAVRQCDRAVRLRPAGRRAVRRQQRQRQPESADFGAGKAHGRGLRG